MNIEHNGQATEPVKLNVKKSFMERMFPSFYDDKQDNVVEKFVNETKRSKRFLFTFRTFQFTALMFIGIMVGVLLGSLNQIYKQVYKITVSVSKLEYRVSLLNHYNDAISCKPLQEQLLKDTEMQMTNKFARQEAIRKGFLESKK